MCCGADVFALLPMFLLFCRYFPSSVDVSPLLLIFSFFCRYFPSSADIFLLLPMFSLFCRYFPSSADVFPLLPIFSFFCRCFPSSADIHVARHVHTKKPLITYRYKRFFSKNQRPQQNQGAFIHYILLSNIQSVHCSFEC